MNSYRRLSGFLFFWVTHDLNTFFGRSALIHCVLSFRFACLSAASVAVTLIDQEGLEGVKNAVVKLRRWEEGICWIVPDQYGIGQSFEALNIYGC